MSKIITVLGASGNVGKLVVSYLAEKAYNVRAVGRKLPKFTENGVTNHAVSYESQEELTKVCDGSQAVYILIGLEYKASIWQEEWPPLVDRIIEACEKSGGKLVFFDNVYSYGLVEGKMVEESPLNAQTKKGLVRKELVEKILKANNEGRIKAVIAKSADFYGPGITTSVVGDRFFDLIINKDTVEIFGNPKKIHNYTYVKDIPVALEKLASSDFTGNIHLPTGPAVTGYKYQELMEKLTGKKLKITNLGQNMAWFLGIFIPILRELYEMMYQNENDYNFDSHKIIKLFPDLKVTPYEEGFKETLDWWEKKVKQS